MRLIDLTLDSGLTKQETVAPTLILRDYIVNTILEDGKEVEQYKVERFNELLRFLGIEEIDYKDLVLKSERSKSLFALEWFAKYLSENTDMKGDVDYFMNKGLFTISEEDGNPSVAPSLTKHLIAFYESLEDMDN